MRSNSLTFSGKDTADLALVAALDDVVAALVNSLEARSKAMRPGVGGIYFINNSASRPLPSPCTKTGA